MKKIFVAFLMLMFSATLFAQCPNQYGSTPEDSIKCREQLSNFILFNKSKNYVDAYVAWRNVIEMCPCAWEGLYTNAQNLFTNLIKDEKDSARREHLIDTLIYSYDLSTQSFPAKFSSGYALGHKAYNMMMYRSKQMSPDQLKELNQMFINSVEAEKENTKAVIWDKYFLLSKSLTNGYHDTSIVIDAYGRATDYLETSYDNTIAEYESQVAALDSLNAIYTAGTIDRIEYDKKAKTLTQDTTRLKQAANNYRKVLVKIEKEVAPYASCEVLQELYTKKLEDPAVRNDLLTINKMVKTLANAGCILEPIFKDVLEIQHNTAPNRSSAYWMGYLSMHTFGKTGDKAELDRAIVFFNQATGLSVTNEQKADVYYMLATAYKLKLQYSEARTAAYAALKANPNMGKAYILIGDLYKTSGSRCSDGVPYDYSWAAADKYAKAVAVDPSCAAEANEARAGLRFPSSDDLFKRGLNKGASYHVGCWIQENTTVR